MKRLLFLTLICALSAPVFAQDERPEQAPNESGFMFGLHYSDRGPGLNLAVLKGAPYRQWLFGLDIFLVKDSKETLIEPFFGEQGKRYVFGKLNHLFVVSPSLGVQWDMVPRSAVNLLNVRGNLKVGPAIGILNPYHLEIFEASPGSPFVGTREILPYDPANHSYSKIIGRANFLSSRIDPTFRFGLSVQANAILDFSSVDAAITGVNLGMKVDAFPSPVPIMADELQNVQNQRIFVAISAGLMFGRRW
ncbi:MAG: hypothetical protein AAF206_09995 [Bacteroidota bacterium]